MEITIRRLSTFEEYTTAEELQQICWQTDPIDAVPAHLLLTIQNEAGLVLGAFTPPGELIGFVFGFLGREGDTLKHCSHMAAVHPYYRDHNLGYRLKLAQRSFMLEQGLEICTWTYDPLEARNAVLNIAKLGATARIYKRNIYGQRLGGLNAALPTDRFHVRWEVKSDRALHCVNTGQRVMAPIAGQSEQMLTRVVMQGDLPLLAATGPLPADDVIGVQIPANFQRVKRENVEAASHWRLGARALFENAFRAGYTVVNVTADAEHPESLAVYTLMRD